MQTVSDKIMVYSEGKACLYFTGRKAK